MIRYRVLPIAVLCFALAGVANASWYDDYDAGVKAARQGNWAVVIDRMTKAINGNGNENNKARTYGAIFINYHPYYYRGVALSNLGRYEQAIADFEKTSGPGEYDMGSLDTLIKSAKTKQAEANTPTPEPVPNRPNIPVPQPTPQPSQPTGPVLDNALRSRATSALNQARARIEAAKARRATGAAQYSNAVQNYADANNKLANPRSNEDLSAAIAAAENAAEFADLAQPPSAIPTVTVATTTTRPTRPEVVTGEVLAVPAARLRTALESYFAGEFSEAASGFQTLTRDMPRNGWIWAFLGASQWSQYAFEADESYKQAAIRSFQKARGLGFGKNGLPTKYFSRRIRKAFEDTRG